MFAPDGYDQGLVVFIGFLELLASLRFEIKNEPVRVPACFVDERI